MTAEEIKRMINDFYEDLLKTYPESHEKSIKTNDLNELMKHFMLMGEKAMCEIFLEAIAVTESEKDGQDQ